jgi:hypothetical protein
MARQPAKKPPKRKRAKAAATGDETWDGPSWGGEWPYAPKVIRVPRISAPSERTNQLLAEIAARLGPKPRKQHARAVRDKYEPVAQRLFPPDGKAPKGMAPRDALEQLNAALDRELGKSKKPRDPTTLLRILGLRRDK